jgi:ADP-ribose pyrophosphatase YjhB (NUDIX family)
MKKNSCGAILYTIKDNKVYIILGKESRDWFPFKGVCEKNETLEEAAIREIEEETCRIVKINNIALDCKYASYRKIYHIGLIYVDKNFVKKFYYAKKKLTESKDDENDKYLEKNHIKMFSLDELDLSRLHYVTLIPIVHYWNYLCGLQVYINNIMISRQINRIIYEKWQTNRLQNIKICNY